MVPITVSYCLLTTSRSGADAAAESAARRERSALRPDV